MTYVMTQDSVARGAPQLDSMLCGHILKSLITFEQGNPHFHFALHPTNYIAHSGRERGREKGWGWRWGSGRQQGKDSDGKREKQVTFLEPLPCARCFERPLTLFLCFSLLDNPMR